MRSTGKTLLCVLVVIGAAGASKSSPESTTEVDICNEEQKFRCEEGELISVIDIICGTGSHGCAPSTNQTLLNLCQGQQTCSAVGLAGIFSSVCQNDVTHSDANSLHVRFKCLPGSTSLCRSNICAANSPGLICPKGSHVHIRRMSCSTVTGQCSRSSYTNLYLCEGVDRCASSGLKALLPQNCQNNDISKRNVIISYFCVPGDLIEDTCSPTRYRILDLNFGILKSPRPSSDMSTVHPISLCKWTINPIGSNKVTVTVHLVSAKATVVGCNPGVLNIRYVDCINGSTLTRSFCDVGNASVELESCGQVRITSMVPKWDESVDEFIVSYQRHESSVTSSIPSGLPVCIPPAVIKMPEKPPQSKPSSGSSVSKPVPIARNFGPADGIFDYRDSSQGGSGVNKGDGSSTLSKQLKLMILYIFFGVVILVLAVALIAVIVSYHRISKFKAHRGDSSEKTALWQHHEDTPLDTFQHNSFVEGTGPLTSETTYSFRSDREPDQVVATVHHDAISENDEFDHRLSSGSGISTFLGGKRDSDFKDLINTFQTGSFAVYSTLEDSNSSDTNDHQKVEGEYYEVPDSGHYDLPSNGDINNIYEVIDRDNQKNSGRSKNRHSNSFSPDMNGVKGGEDEHHVVANHDQQPLVNPQYSPADDMHYCVNNDEYAIVRKSRKPTKVQNITTVGDDPNHMYENCSDNGSSVGFHPTSGPYDQKRNSGSDSRARWSKGERWTDEL